MSEVCFFCRAEQGEPWRESEAKGDWDIVARDFGDSTDRLGC
jgi:hypothetical protein